MGKEMEKEKNIIICGKLEFEGEYLNGKRNGKGNEYNGKVLLFIIQFFLRY